MNGFLKALAMPAIVIGMSSAAQAGVVFSASSFNQSLSLSNTNFATGVAYSAGTYEVGSGGNSGSPITTYTSAGVRTASSTPNPQLDFRSLFTDASGAVYAHGYNNTNTIYKQGSSYNIFTAYVTLQGSVDNQATIVLNSAGTQYVGLSGGVLTFWNLNGSIARTLSTSMSGFSFAIFGNYGLNAQGNTLFAYDLTSGAIVDQTTLNGAGGSSYGQSYANGYFFTQGSDSNSVAAYQIGAPAASAVPEPASWAMMIGGFGMVGGALRRRAKVSVGFAA